jgi:hypothetical protein
MSKVITVMLLIIFGITGVVAFGYMRQTINQTNEAIASYDPVTDFMREIFVEATPVVLPDPATLVREVNKLASLQTASYIAEKIVRVEQGDSQLLFGLFSDNLILLAHGEVIAGVDLAKMTEQDIQVIDPTTVMVHLPPAEILVATLNNEKTQVIDRDTGLLASDNAQLETMARQSGEAAILEAALEYGLLQEAQTNAEDYMRNFLGSLGFETVIFTAETPPPAPPYEQVIPKGYILTTPAP